MAFMVIPACLLAELPKAVLTSKASANSLPPSPLRLLPVGATPYRAGLPPAENRRLGTAHFKEQILYRCSLYQGMADFQGIFWAIGEKIWRL